MLQTVILKTVSFSFVTAAMVFLGAAFLACVSLLLLSKDKKKAEKKDGKTANGEKKKPSFADILLSVVTGKEPGKKENEVKSVFIDGFPIGSSKIPVVPLRLKELEGEPFVSDNPFVISVDERDGYRMTARHAGTADIRLGDHLVYALLVEPLYENPLQDIMDRSEKPATMAYMRGVEFPGYRKDSERSFFIFYRPDPKATYSNVYSSLYTVFGRKRGFRASCVTMKVDEWKAALPAIHERFEAFPVAEDTVENHPMPASTIWMNRTGEGKVGMMLFSFPVGGSRTEDDCEWMKVYMSGVMTTEPYEVLASENGADDIERFAKVFRLMELEVASISIGNTTGHFYDGNDTAEEEKDASQMSDEEFMDSLDSALKTASTIQASSQDEQYDFSDYDKNESLRSDEQVPDSNTPGKDAPNEDLPDDNEIPDSGVSVGGVPEKDLPDDNDIPDDDHVPGNTSSDGDTSDEGNPAEDEESPSATDTGPLPEEGNSPDDDSDDNDDDAEFEKAFEKWRESQRQKAEEPGNAVKNPDIGVGNLSGIDDGYVHRPGDDGKDDDPSSHRNS